MAKRTDKLMMMILSGAVLSLLLAVLIGRRLVQAPPPPRPGGADGGQAAAPPPDPRCGAIYYGALLKDAAQKYQVPEPTLAQLQQPLPGGTEFRGARLLRPGRDTLDTPHLRISVQVAKLEASDGAQGFRADHLVLSITNKGTAPVAYRVLTRMSEPEKCALKADLPHNAIALRPRETARRTECLYHPRLTVAVLQVDAYELTELGHRFLSRLVPVEGGPFDMRVARSHDRGELAPCRSLPWRDLDEGTDIWLTVIDFHARHDCDEYSLPRGYRPFTVPGALPVCSSPLL
jgi:hypothetical protein